MRSPDVLILNEATSALDSGSQTRVISKYNDRYQRKKIFFGLFSELVLADAFDRVLVMSGGRVIENR